MHLTRKDKGGIFAFVALILLYYDSWTMFVRPSIAKLSRAPRELARAGKFRAKEVYSERRERVLSTCSSPELTADPLVAELNSDSERWKRHLWHSVEHKFSYCGIAKVGTTTWAKILMKMAGSNWQYILSLYNKLGVIKDQRRRNMKTSFFKVPSDFSLNLAREEHFSFTFVRHPYTRLVSGYRNKFMKNWTDLGEQDMRGVRDEIAQKFAHLKRTDPPFSIFIPTPTQFLKYLVHEFESSGPVGMNPNWRPQWASCPHCSFNFDVIGKMETFNDDTEFILDTIGAQSQFCSNVQRATSSKRERWRVESFFQDVPDYLKNKVFKLYERDFLMFGYDPDKVP